MTHPLLPAIIELARQVATPLELEVVDAAFYTHLRPPAVRIDVRHISASVSLDDCERMSRALEPVLDEANIIPHAYVLEISSPGASEMLTADREFAAFKGFPVVVTLKQSVNGQSEWRGNLVRRDETAVHLSRKGRAIVLPRTDIIAVTLDRVDTDDS
jgi:ribosome maturation factor RimP